MTRPSGRSVAICFALLAGIAAGTLGALRLTAHDGTTTLGVQGPSTSTPTEVTEAPAPTVAALPPTTNTTLPATTLVAPTPSRPAPAGSDDPKTVARNFALAFLAWRWDGQPDPEAAVRAAARPWDTDVLDAQLATSSGGGTFTARRTATHEVSTPTVANLDPPDPQTERTARYLALVTIVTTSDASSIPTKRSVYLDMRLTKDAGGRWLVNEART